MSYDIVVVRNICLVFLLENKCETLSLSNKGFIFLFCFLVVKMILQLLLINIVVCGIVDVFISYVHVFAKVCSYFIKITCCLY